jgi:hypothetical protein
MSTTPNNNTNNNIIISSHLISWPSHSKSTFIPISLSPHATSSVVFIVERFITNFVRYNEECDNLYANIPCGLIEPGANGHIQLTMMSDDELMNKSPTQNFTLQIRSTPANQALEQLIKTGVENIATLLEEHVKEKITSKEMSVNYITIQAGSSDPNENNAVVVASPALLATVDISPTSFIIDLNKREFDKRTLTIKSLATSNNNNNSEEMINMFEFKNITIPGVVIEPAKGYIIKDIPVLIEIKWWMGPKATRDPEGTTHIINCVITTFNAQNRKDIVQEIQAGDLLAQEAILSLPKIQEETIPLDFTFENGDNNEPGIIDEAFHKIINPCCKFCCFHFLENDLEDQQRKWQSWWWRVCIDCGPCMGTPNPNVDVHQALHKNQRINVIRDGVMVSITHGGNKSIVHATEIDATSLGIKSMKATISSKDTIYKVKRDLENAIRAKDCGWVIAYNSHQLGGYPEESIMDRNFHARYYSIYPTTKVLMIILKNRPDQKLIDSLSLQDQQVNQDCEVMLVLNRIFLQTVPLPFCREGCWTERGERCCNRLSLACFCTWCCDGPQMLCFSEQRLECEACDGCCCELDVDGRAHWNEYFTKPQRLYKLTKPDDWTNNEGDASMVIRAINDDVNRKKINENNNTGGIVSAIMVDGDE